MLPFDVPLPPWEVVGGLLLGVAGVITALVTLAKTLAEVRAARAHTEATASKMAAISHELRPNHGSSLRDSADRTEFAVGQLATEMRALRDDLADVRQAVRRHDAELGRANQLLAQAADRANQADRHLSTQLDDHSQRLRSLETLAIHDTVPTTCPRTGGSNRKETPS